MTAHDEVHADARLTFRYTMAMSAVFIGVVLVFILL